MAKAEIYSGACGYTTTVNTTMNGKMCQIGIESDCTAIQKLAAELTEVEPYKEISSRRQLPKTLEMGIKHCTHAACPVPVGIIKAVEIESGLNLPVDVSIKLSK
ncbi:MAG: hypothetical protein H6669_09350 [Ardenticatenaceae bacterium]|nr:hypothetical protein [Ardenticatenaceae bacterium]